MRKLDCYAGAALSLLLAVTMLRYEGIVQALEPEPVETAVEEAAPIEEPIPPDYSAMATMCYEYVRGQNHQIVERVGMEFADGLAISKSEDFLYLADTIYFDNSLMMRFVGSQGKVITVFANPDRVYEISELSKLQTFTEDDAIVALGTVLQNVAQYQEQDIPLMYRQLLDVYFSDEKIRSRIALDICTGVPVEVVYSNCGISALNLPYYDVAIFQFSSGEELVTLLLRLNESGRVVDIDVL